MATNFLELATTLTNLGAKWLPEKKKLILRPGVCLPPLVIKSAYMLPTNDLWTNLNNKWVTQILDTEMY